jgi:Ser/Thr protein kinase RdoA (MazF antagonist)
MAMQDFAKLTHHGQVRRLRRCSESVLPQYGVSDPVLATLAHHRQTVFKVTSQATGQRYVLRYCQPEYRSPATVRSEFCWLRFLRGSSDVVVPEPVATLDGEDVSSVTMEGLPKGLHCSMTKWVEGKRYFRKLGPGERVLREVGRIMATMHRHAESFLPPEDFHCPVWNWDRLFGRIAAETSDAEQRLVSAEGCRLIRETEQRIRVATNAVGTGREMFGVIHGDLIQANYLVHQGEVRVIDFADFGFGHFLYDMGITLFGLWGLDADHKQRRAFLSGYRAVRPIAPDHEELLNLFIAARGVVQARFVMQSPHLDDQRIGPKYIRKVIDGLSFWLS